MGPNAKLIELLNEFARIYDIIGEVYRVKAYTDAAGAIARLDYKITPSTLPTDRGPGRIPGLGRSIVAKIAEYVRTGRIDALDRLHKDPTIVSYEVFGRILGVGPATIRSWLRMGIKTLPDLRHAISSRRVTLNHVQSLGLKYYTDLNTRIPRNEVTEIGHHIHNIIEDIDQSTLFDIAGSYRRGLPTSGDIDILLSGPDYLLEEFAEIITHDPAFVAIVTMGEQRLTFLIKWGARVRQVDLLNIPRASYYAALVYFTGSGPFNERMRGLARKRGFRLNQMGLFTAKDKRIIPVTSERAIFDKIGMTYIEPRDRDL